MKLTQEILKIKTPTLLIKHYEDANIPYNYLLNTAAGKLVAVGCKINDLVNEGDSFRENYFLLKEASLTNSLLTIEQSRNWAGLIFLINKTNIWYFRTDAFVIAVKKEDNLDDFLKILKDHFPELKSPSDILEEKSQSLLYENKKLTEMAVEFEKEVKILKERINQLEEQSQRTENDIRRSDEVLKSEKQNTLILEKAIQYLSDLNKKGILKRLTEKQKITLLNLMNDGYKTNPGYKWPLGAIEVNFDLLYPNIIVKIPSTRTEAFDNANDFIPLPYFIYELVDANGQNKPISFEEIKIRNPKAVFGLEALWMCDLKVCTWIKEDDLK